MILSLCVCVLTVPSSPPLPGASRNLSSTSIHVSWFPPVEANGEIIEYTVVLQGPGADNRTYTSETHLILSELTPFTPYNLSIAAVTRLGVGPSVIIPLHTDEAGQRHIFTAILLTDLLKFKSYILGFEVCIWNLFKFEYFKTENLKSLMFDL